MGVQRCCVAHVAAADRSPGQIGRSVAETCGRISLSMELDPAYVDVAVTRWQTFTGEAATLDGDGRGFAEVALARDDP